MFFEHPGMWLASWNTEQHNSVILSFMKSMQTYQTKRLGGVSAVSKIWKSGHHWIVLFRVLTFQSHNCMFIEHFPVIALEEIIQNGVCHMYFHNFFTEMGTLMTKFSEIVQRSQKLWGKSGALLHDAWNCEKNLKGIQNPPWPGFMKSMQAQRTFNRNFSLFRDLKVWPIL